MALADNKVKIQSLLAGIKALPEAGSGEPTLQDKTVSPSTAAQTVTPDSGYDGLSKVNVGAIPDEYIIPSGTVDITANGTHNVREAENVNVSVPAPEITLQEKTVTPATTAQTVEPDSGYDGLSAVTVEQIPADYVIPSGEKSITENGTHDVAGFASVNVAVESGGSGGVNVDTCSFSADIAGLSSSYHAAIFCAWTEFYEGIFEYCEDGGENYIIEGYPVCNTVLYVWWDTVSGWSSDVEVSGAVIIHQIENSVAICMPAEAGSNVAINVTYSR